MAALFLGNSMWNLLRQSDAITLFVLFILFCMSVFCWTVFICLAILMRLKKRSVDQARKKIKALSSTQDILVLTTQLSGTIPGYFLSEVLIFAKSMVEARAGRKEMSHYHELEYLQRHIDQTVDNLVTHQEAYLPILSTSAAVAPLLGLFGTVWGLIHAFIRISEKQAADITVVAPGIAEALLTTLAGLLVAIPALIMYNYLAVQVRKIEYGLIQLADKVSFLLQGILLS